MNLNKKELELLKTLRNLTSKLLEEKSSEEASARSKLKGTRKRRSRKEAAKVKQEIIAARARGVAVKKISEKHGVTTAYVYQITGRQTP